MMKFLTLTIFAGAALQVLTFFQVPEVPKGIGELATPAVNVALWILLWSMHKEQQRLNTAFLKHILKHDGKIDGDK
jgi:hypothetical protein